MSPSLMMSTTTAFRPPAWAAVCTSRIMDAAMEMERVVSSPIVARFGTTSRNSPICFVATRLPRKVAPVTLPPGWFRLATMPVSTGSPAVVNTIGMVAVAALAECTAPSPPTAASAATGICTSSAASSGSRVTSPSAER